MPKEFKLANLAFARALVDIIDSAAYTAESIEKSTFMIFFFKKEWNCQGTKGGFYANFSRLSPERLGQSQQILFGFRLPCFLLVLCCFLRKHLSAC